MRPGPTIWLTNIRPITANGQRRAGASTDASSLCEILQQLVMHAGKVLTHRHLLREVWGGADSGDVQSLRVFIRQLRQKLEPDPARPRHIVTEPGVGYRLLAGD